MDIKQFKIRKMPVAVRLVEVLTLITLLGILTGLSIFVVVAQRLIFLLLLFITVSKYLGLVVDELKIHRFL